MVDEKILEELFGLFVRLEMPAEIRAAIATHFGKSKYMLSKEAVIASLSDTDPIVRDACISVVANDWRLAELGPKLTEIMERDPQDFVQMAAAQGLGSTNT